MFTLLFLTGLGVWGFFGAMFLLSCALITALEYEKGFASFLVFGSMTAMFLFGTEPSGLLFLKENIAMVPVAIAGYLAAGVVWGIAKWWFFVRRIRDTYQGIKDDFLNSKKITDGKIPDALLVEFRQYCSTNGGRRSWSNGDGRRYSLEFSEDGSVIAPIVNNHKARITSWMVYWPWSALWTLIDDPIRRIYNRIYTALRGLYQNISNSAFQSVGDDFRAPPAPPAPPTANSSDEGHDPNLDGHRDSSGSLITTDGVGENLYGTPRVPKPRATRHRGGVGDNE